ncbi:MAG: ATP-binding protein [Cyclobacteriaceae bacterium]
MDHVKLFSDSFKLTHWKDEKKLNQLLLSIEKANKIIQKYLGAIHVLLPGLTDHSIDHSRMLWNYANIIVGDHNLYLNPVEAYALHLSFLVHDSGLCYSILNLEAEITTDPLYTDFISKYGDSQENRDNALFFTLREKHGDYAVKIATEEFRDGEYLIEDSYLRHELGLLIGKIAKSHTCNINYIERELGSKYAMPDYPVNWTLDCRKVAFLLRVADAAHIDSLRSPKTLKRISEIKGTSQDHWVFQKKLGFPTLGTDGLLAYASNSPFSAVQQKAWWYCVNALEVLDSELKKANEYFAIQGEVGFSAKGVKAVANSLELGTNYIRTDGWKAVDTKIRVTDPVLIASELGGIRLYGNANVSLRELIQNSLDAVNLHRFQTRQNGNFRVGEINIGIEKVGDDFWLIVQDNGIGMSQTLLTNELLDFGGSYWRSSLDRDFPGLRTRGFNSIGKFGIGFFSVFMLGDQVNVTSWKFGESIDSMKTLDFHDGINSSPILRDPTEEERNIVTDRGTLIRVRLKNDPYGKEGIVGCRNLAENTLYSLVRHFIPSPSVKLVISEVDGSQKTIDTNYIDNLDYRSLIEYLYVPHQVSIIDYTTESIEVYKSLDLELIEIEDAGRSLGRLSLLPSINNLTIGALGIVLSDGILVNNLNGFAGYIITNDVVSVKRDSFTKLISYDALKCWAIKQKSLIEEKKYIELFNAHYYSLLLSFDLYQDEFPIALKKKNNSYYQVSVRELCDYLKENDVARFHNEGHSVLARKPDCEGFIYYPFPHNLNSIVRDSDIDKLLTSRNYLEGIIRDYWGDFHVDRKNLVGGFNWDVPYFSIDTYSKVN